MSEKYIRNAYDVISRFFEKKYPEELEERVQRWLADDKHESEKDEALKQYWDELTVANDKRAKNVLAEIKAKAGIDAGKKRVPLGRMVLRVAAVVLPLLMIAGGYVMWIEKQEKINRLGEALTGEVVKIMVYEKGVEEHGGVALADGSVVWLDPGSRLETPDRFFDKERRIKFTGGGQFKVAKQPGVPFVVETESITIWVLGTEFELKAYTGEENVNVKLITGSIAVETPAGETIEMVPGEELTYNVKSAKAVLKAPEVYVQQPESEPETEMPEPDNDPIVFENVPLGEIFKILEQRRGVKIDIGAAELAEECFSIKFIYGETLEQMMQTLEILVGGFTYMMEENTVYVNFN